MLRWVSMGVGARRGLEVHTMMTQLAFVATAPIFLDSPLAIRATEVFRKHAADLDEEVDVERLLSSPHLRFTETVEESKAIAKLEDELGVPLFERSAFGATPTAFARTLERRAQTIIEEAKARANDEAAKIVAAARAEADQQIVKARETLRDQVAALAVKGAEQILRKEVNAGVHADLLNRLKAEL